MPGSSQAFLALMLEMKNFEVDPAPGWETAEGDVQKAAGLPPPSRRWKRSPQAGSSVGCRASRSPGSFRKWFYSAREDNGKREGMKHALPAVTALQFKGLSRGLVHPWTS